MDDTVEMEDGDEGTELECDEDGGESKSWKEDSNGSFSFSSFSQSIKSSNSFRLIIFLSSHSLPASTISSIVL